MKITVVGLGFVGTVAAACLANAGHTVTGVDCDPDRVGMLRAGRLPLYEPGLAEIIETARARASVRFEHTQDFRQPLGEVALITVGTPPLPDGAADLRQVRSAVQWLQAQNPRATTLVMKSTVPPGTGLQLAGELAGSGIRYVANPEFLRAGQAIHDWENPRRIVIGVGPAELPASNGHSTNGPAFSEPAFSGPAFSGPAFSGPVFSEPAFNVIRAVNGNREAPCIITDYTSAEMVKYASNAFLATRVSFINEIAMLCEQVGASIDVVSRGVGLDPRTGARIYAGVGYGGSCLPKDVGALARLASAGEAPLQLLPAVDTVNRRQRLLPLAALRERFDGEIAGRRVAVLGLAFKPGTDDIRDAPALDLIRALCDAGALVSAYDPHAVPSARRVAPASVTFRDDPVAAAAGAPALVVMTEWDQIVNADWPRIAKRMRRPHFVFDGRNALDPVALTRLGFEYHGIGRSGAADRPAAGAVRPSGDRLRLSG